MGTTRTTGLIRIMASTDRIRTMAIIIGLHITGTAGVATITATTVIIGTITGTIKVT
jgi:hypothetical protein